MRIAFVILLVIHSFIHLLGFVEAFQPAAVKVLSLPISKLMGIFWLVALFLLLYAAVLFAFKNYYWLLYGLAGIIISQVVIFNSWQEAKYGTMANGIILLVLVTGYAAWSFNKQYTLAVRESFGYSEKYSVPILTEVDIQYLPEPVKKYLHYTRSVGKPELDNFRVEFRGKLRKNKQSEWMPFTSEQYNFIGASKRFFFMNATRHHLPVAGFHSFRNGNAFMNIRLLSLFKVQYQSGYEMGKAETVTFFNDMCCLAPATLIDKRIKWLETSGNQVKASFTNNHITITAWLHFNDKGELINFISNDRYAYDKESGMRQIPWETPLKNYREINGYKLAGHAQAIYKYPEGDLCYGIFEITDIQYNCDRL
ncbi:DUF6544 family protein [Emticicia sp. 17c]|uniref:DUF6544 family protein n=1 Tax=Emticicia sp. 17c TaxID=3127704 RepID=UPI00301C7E90